MITTEAIITVAAAVVTIVEPIMAAVAADIGVTAAAVVAITIVSRQLKDHGNLMLILLPTSG